MPEKTEIIGAFNIGTQKGEPIEKIKQTLLNAGYDPQDVEDSARAFSSGGMKPAVKPLKPEEKKEGKEEIKSTEGQPAKPEEQKSKEKGLSKTLLILIIVAAVAFLGAVGFLLYRLLLK